MKRILTCFLIVCLMFSVLPLGIENEFGNQSIITGEHHKLTVSYSETTIDMSTSCKPLKAMCRLLTLLESQIKPTEFTVSVSGKLTEVKGTKYRKIITFESNGDGEDPCIYI